MAFAQYSTLRPSTSDVRARFGFDRPCKKYRQFDSVLAVSALLENSDGTNVIELELGVKGVESTSSLAGRWDT